jgi:hypothetical protein
MRRGWSATRTAAALDDTSGALSLSWGQSWSLRPSAPGGAAPALARHVDAMHQSTRSVPAAGATVLTAYWRLGGDTPGSRSRSVRVCL